MSFEDSKNRQIAVSVGVQIAGELAVASAAAGGGDPFQLFEMYAAGVVETVITLQAANALAEAFPGTVAVPHVAGPMPAARAAANAVFPDRFGLSTPTGAGQAAFPAAAPAPVAIPGAADGDPAVAALWTEFFKDPTAWYDNSVGKTNPRGPDFKHKTQGGAATGNKALWINDKKNPSWVAAGLRQAGVTA
jgi:hypothetical protein